MKGKVIAVNNSTCKIKVLNENRNVSVIEILDDLPEVGDILEGSLESLGGEMLFNLTKQTSLDVFIDDILI
ncbi:hypothetical protein ACQCN2_16215 [Brevibacillus ginsengisoli]|uniref:hypothetical protein n=1 Tax=Brevibacillus ginsengisoli TaxID=363854 RepID=UPI003CE8BBF9